MVASVALLFPIGLAVDCAFGLAGTLAMSVVTWWMLALVWRAADRTTRKALVVCVLWATAGEIFLTEAWGLYEYGFGFVPPFVPPGHALLFQLGVWVTATLGAFTRRALVVATVPVTLAGWVFLGDQQSLLFLAVLLLLACIGPTPALYGTMFFLSLVLELIGTALGTWCWAPREEWFGMATFNPPIAAGAFYCCLDALTVGWRRKDSVTDEPRCEPAGMVPSAVPARVHDEAQRAG